MEWINRVNSIINKQIFDISFVGDVQYNELDIVLSLIQTNTSLADISLDTKNIVSLLSNILERISQLTKEIALVKNSFDLQKTIYINNKQLYYNFRLDTYLDENDIRKLEEAHRRCLDLFKQFTRKIIYLIVTGKKDIDKEIAEIEKQKQQLIPFIPLTPMQQTIQSQRGEQNDK